MSKKNSLPSNENRPPVGDVWNIGDIIEPSVKFYPDAARIDFTDLLGRPITLLDAKIITTTSPKFGSRESALLYVDIDGNLYTTITSGQVIVNKIKQLIDASRWPVACTAVKEKSVRYYDLV